MRFELSGFGRKIESLGDSSVQIMIDKGIAKFSIKDLFLKKISYEKMTMNLSISLIFIFLQLTAYLEAEYEFAMGSTKFAQELSKCGNDSLFNHKNTECNSEYRYRSVDGVCNNLRNIWYGAASTPFNRLLNAQYDDGYQAPRTFSSETGRRLPNARLVARTLKTEQKATELDALVIFFGQFVTHDITLIPKDLKLNCNNCTTKNPECFNIEIPIGDSLKRDCLPFRRNLDSIDSFDCPLSVRTQFNEITHWLDSSNVYGSSIGEMRKLRLFKDGLLKTSSIPGSDFESLPIQNITACTERIGCFFAGDERVEENTMLTAIHTFFVREHNRLAREYKKLNPRLNDETIYQEIKRIVNAVYQNIIYSEFLPIVVGKELMKIFDLNVLRRDHLLKYHEVLVPNAFNEFVAAAGRMHTQIENHIQLADDRLLSVGTRSISTQLFQTSDSFFDLDNISRGCLIGSAMRHGQSMSTDLNNRLFENIIFKDQSHENNNNLGGSLTALNVQRGREHGIPSYNEYRKLAGLNYAKSFEDLEENVSPENIERMKSVYSNVNDVDLFYGAISEDMIEDGLVGRTNADIFARTFHNLKFGDRFYFENGENPLTRFNLGQLDEIRHITMATIMCNSLQLEFIQERAFFKANTQTNILVRCNQIRQLNLAMF